MVNQIHSSLNRPRDRSTKSNHYPKAIVALLVIFALVATIVAFTPRSQNPTREAASLLVDSIPDSHNTVLRTPSVSSPKTSSETVAKKTMGYIKTIIKEGNGEKPAKGSYVTVHCTGYGKDRDMSQKFWSTKDPGQQPFTFRIGMGEVIKAWDESVLTMSIGEISKVDATPDYAYGAGGFPSWGIQPNSDLSFEIEVLKYSFTAP